MDRNALAYDCYLGYKADKLPYIRTRWERRHQQRDRGPYTGNTDDYAIILKCVSRSKSCNDRESHKTDHDPRCDDHSGSMITGGDCTKWRKRTAIAVKMQGIWQIRLRHG